MTSREEFGHYRLVRLLGVGGMGEVYLARDLTLDRDVAIKLLPVGQTEDRDARRRLLREAQAAARLDHPAICQVFEVGETPEGRAFIAMSYVEGETLAARIARGPLPLREALAMARDIADALSAAHAQGIVHRDLKPQNVMVTPSGRPKLLDFGVAKLRLSDALHAEATTATGATLPGVVVGTPAYMSPEQVSGGVVDARSDLFALGALLFECLTGRRAFDGTNALSILGAIVHVHPPSVSTIRPETPPEVDELCARLLAKDPSDRFQTAPEVVGALRLLLPITHKSVTPAPPVPSPVRPTSRARARATWVVVGIAAALAAVWTYQSWRPLPQPTVEAERWYRRGTEFIREGAYHSAAVALEQAIRQFPSYALAYARLAEALAELDDQKRASEQLLRMQDVLGDESRLPELDRRRLSAIRAVVLRDLTRAVDAYRAIVERTPDDAGAWVDLGRAQESAEQRREARESYKSALSRDADLAAAHVRLASMAAQAGERAPALEAFASAERLYKAASNVEGEIEVLLRRGSFLDARGELAPARRDLERARALASGSGSTAQSVRARLALGTVIAWEGRIGEAESQIVAATEEARKAGLWLLVADGFIDLGGVLVDQPGRRDEADQRVREAIELATARGAQRTAARATLQRAALALQREEPSVARDLAASTIAFLKPQGYRRLELTALTIVGRAQRNLDDLAGARATATEVLQAATALEDSAQISLALASLAGVATAAGDLPAALEARTRAEGINHEIGDEEAIPFDLTNRAELLVQLGRVREAEELLTAVDDGIRRGVEAYTGRLNRVNYLRALAAVVKGDLSAAARFAARVVDAARPTESVAMLARGVLSYAHARQPPSGRATPRLPEPAPPPASDVLREMHYWSALAARARRDDRRALEEATAGLVLAERVSNDELAWRLGAVGYLAASVLGEESEAARMDKVLVAARERLQHAWQAAFRTYDTRRDLQELRGEIDRTRPSTRRSS